MLSNTKNSTFRLSHKKPLHGEGRITPDSTVTPRVSHGKSETIQRLFTSFGEQIYP